MTRKHFQMIADVVKNIDDETTRHETAMNFAARYGKIRIKAKA